MEHHPYGVALSAKAAPRCVHSVSSEITRHRCREEHLSWSPLVAVALTCWLCAVLALPRKPRRNDELQELVYARLLGRQQTLMLVALVATALAFMVFVAGLPQRTGTDEEGAPVRQRLCSDSPLLPSTCYTRLSDGQWTEEQLQADGSWRIVDIVSRPYLAEKEQGA
jgi:hypothetical protein